MRDYRWGCVVAGVRIVPWVGATESWIMPQGWSFHDRGTYYENRR